MYTFERSEKGMKFFMLNLKNEKGAITLFVLVSCLFFILSVTCVQMYMQSKKVAVDREYRQIKSNYETNLADTEYLDKTYYQLSQLENLNINIEKTTHTNNQLIVEFSLSDVTNLNAQTVKYGWGTSSSIDTVATWNYLEADSIKNKMIAINNNASADNTNYHLFVVLDNKEIYTPIVVS